MTSAWGTTRLVVAATLILVGGCAVDKNRTGGSSPTSLARSASPEASRSPGPSAVTSLHPVDLTGIDWANARYPLDCVGGQERSAAFHRGTVTVDGTLVTVKHPVFGVLGSGLTHTQPVAVVRIYCSRASQSPDTLLVYTATPAGPHLLGYALQSTENVYVKDISFQDGGMYVEGDGHSAKAPECCPDLLITSVFALPDNATLTRVSYDIAPNAEGGGDSQVDPATGAAFACAQVRLARSKILRLDQLVVSLQGGSVEGVPTYDEAATIGNMSQIFAVQSQIRSLRQLLPELQQACGG